MSGHSGRPTFRITNYGRVLILCPLGHFVQSVATSDWAGSQMEANVGNPAYEVQCEGATS